MTPTPPSSPVDQKKYPHPCPRCGKVIASERSAIHTCCVTQSPVDEAAVEAAQKIADLLHHELEIDEKGKVTHAGTVVADAAHIITDAYAEQRELLAREIAKNTAGYEAIVMTARRIDSLKSCLTAERAVREKLVKACEYTISILDGTQTENEEECLYRLDAAQAAAEKLARDVTPTPSG